MAARQDNTSSERTITLGHTTGLYQGPWPPPTLISHEGVAYRLQTHTDTHADYYADGVAIPSPFVSKPLRTR